MCPVCDCEPADFIPSCGHATCSACAIRMLRAACDDQRSALNASGFACVQRCEHRIGPKDVEPLLTDPASSRLRAIRSGAPDPGAQFGGRGGDGALGLSYEEYERFRQFVLEASIPVDERVHCPRCERASARADVTTEGGGGGGTRGLRCPHCQHCWRPDATDAQGAVLPPPQGPLEADYKRELATHFGIVFNQLFALTNMPIQRFGSTLISRGTFDGYIDLLRSAHQPGNLEGVMCRTLVSVDWQGYVYDCDFNQMLGLGLPLGATMATRGRAHLSDLIGRNLVGLPIEVRNHCYGCTAGQGSSCGGSLSATPAMAGLDAAPVAAR